MNNKTILPLIMEFSEKYINMDFRKKIFLYQSGRSCCYYCTTIALAIQNSRILSSSQLGCNYCILAYQHTVTTHNNKQKKY